MTNHHLRRIDVLIHLNQINKLAQDLEEHIIHAGDWLFLSNERGLSEVNSCLVRATECASVARQTLEALEEQIRKSESAANRLKFSSRSHKQFSGKAIL